MPVRLQTETLAHRLAPLEDRASRYVHLFAAAASKANATPSGIVEEVVAEVHILLGGRDRDSDGSVALPESTGTPPLRDDARPSRGHGPPAT